jgi:hypothetical protein
MITALELYEPYVVVVPEVIKIGGPPLEVLLRVDAVVFGYGYVRGVNNLQPRKHLSVNRDSHTREFPDADVMAEVNGFL